MSACEILIVGGGTGGCAAALSACRMGMTVIMTEETDWIGGQLTSQIVPPDEHPWIESFGCTQSYRRYRNLVRRHYKDESNLTPEARANDFLNPGSGWVSRLCHDPRIGHLVLNAMLAPFVASGKLKILLRHKLHSASVNGDVVESIRFVHLHSGHFVEF